MTQHTQRQGDHGNNWVETTTGDTHSHAEVSFNAKGMAQISLKFSYDSAVEVIENAAADMEQALNRLAGMLHSHGVEVAGYPPDARDVTKRVEATIKQIVDGAVASGVIERREDPSLDPWIYRDIPTPDDPVTALPAQEQLGAIRACYKALGRPIPPGFNPATFAVAQNLLESLQAEIARRQAASDLHALDFGGMKRH